MAEPQPGLQPIIPRFGPQDGPSPLIPLIVLIIVGTLRWLLLAMVELWSSYEPAYEEWGSMAESVQSQLTLTVFLVPVVLLLAIHAFGIPQMNPVGNAQDSPFVKAITQNFWSSLLLLVIIMALLLSIPFRSAMHSPWQPDGHQPPMPIYTSPRYPAVRRGGAYAASGICQELGILKRRCENWRGYSRDNVCRELSKLQKRCEKSRM